MLKISQPFNGFRAIGEGPVFQRAILVVLVFRDAAADAILAVIQLGLLRLGQMAIVFRHVTLFLPLNAGFALLQMGSFLGAQRAVVDPVGNALLLVSLAAVYLIHPRMAGIYLPRSGARGCGCGLSSGRARQKQATDCQSK